MFEWKQRNGANITTKQISIYDYFVQKYNIRLEFWNLPLIETTRDGLFPMEVCAIEPNQRYQYKLGPDQTAAMIKFAVTRPKERLTAVQHGVGMLKWNADPYLEHFGLKVDPNLTVTQARLLPPPEVQYAGAKANPGTSGRWDLRGKKFLLPNTEPLKSWGVCVINEATNAQAVDNFLKVFVQTYIGHGGKVQVSIPLIFYPNAANIHIEQESHHSYYGPKRYRPGQGGSRH
jgi:eukaryotic translation initiation factor 2C